MAHTQHREPLVIAGAMRFNIEREIQAAPVITVQMARLEALVTELEASLTAQMFENSLAFDKAVIERIKQVAETVGKARQ